MTRGLALRPLAASALAAAALITAGCGGDDETTSTVTAPTTSATTAPTSTSTTEPTTTAPTTTQTTQPTTTTTPTTTTQTTTGGGGIEPDPTKPDSKNNDTKGDANTPEGNFDQFCEQNPGACG